MHKAVLGRHSPTGGRVLCKVKTYFQDTLDHVVALYYHDWFIWHHLCVALTGGPLVEVRFRHSGLPVRSLVVEITVCTADETQ